MNVPAPLSSIEQAHCRRTAALSELLARLAGMTDSEVRTIAQSAFVHDIGKTAIPDFILNKPGSLSEEERMLLRTHTTVGAHILIHTHETMRTASVWHCSTTSVLTAAATWVCGAAKFTHMRNWWR